MEKGEKGPIEVESRSQGFRDRGTERGSGYYWYLRGDAKVLKSDGNNGCLTQ